MNSARQALLTGIAAAVLTFIALVLVEAGASVRIIAFIFLPIVAGTLVALWIWKLSAWREVSQRRAGFLLQAAGALLLGRSVASFGLSAIRASGSFRQPGAEHGIDAVLEYVLGSRGTPAWDVLLAILGILSLMASVWVARGPSRKEAASAVDLGFGAPHSEVKLDPSPISQDQLNRARNYKTFDADFPPKADCWVGRGDELRLARELGKGVVAITGIGGQGKSCLAAKLLEEWRQHNPEGFWDWRDCREEGERLETQLSSVIERVTAGEISPASLLGASTERLIKLLFRITRGATGFLVFDNVDHYADVERGQFVRGIDAIIKEALRTKTELIIVLTCRPQMSYADIAFREIPLKGLTLVEASELFRVKKADIALKDQPGAIERILQHTRGHPFWLNILATQLQRNPEKARHILSELEASSTDDRLVAMLRPVWANLTDHQRHILHILSELPKAETLTKLEQYCESGIPSANRFSRAFKALTSLGLVVAKEEQNIQARYEIHPVVRQFIVREFPLPRQRAEYMKAISAGCESCIAELYISASKGILVAVESYEYSSIGVEMKLRAGDTLGAIKGLTQIHSAFVARGLGRELLRLSDQALSGLSWADPAIPSMEEFHRFVRATIMTLVQNCREKDARELIAKYSPLIPQGTAERIRWCAVMAQFEWIACKYDLAIKWGGEGVALKRGSNLDVTADSEHYLHLGLRDSGKAQEAMDGFLRGSTIEMALKEDHKKSGRHSSYYGNIGRCAFLLGEHDRALSFYLRSADILYGEVDSVSIENQGWAGLWIGEVLVKIGRLDEAVLFFSDCLAVWSKRAPLLLEKLEASMGPLDAIKRQAIQSPGADVRKTCVRTVANWLVSGAPTGSVPGRGAQDSNEKAKAG